MSHEVIMPVLGMNQDSGSIAEWLKQEGDYIKVGDVIMAVETDKAVQDIESRASGYLSEVKYPAGVDVPVGEVIALIVDDEPTQKNSPQQATDTPKLQPQAESGQEQDQQPEQKKQEPKALPPKVDVVEQSQQSVEIESPVTPKANTSSGRLASPKAKRLAAELGINLEQIHPENAQGLIHAADVMESVRSRFGSTAANHQLTQHAASRISIEVDAKRILDCAAWLKEKSEYIYVGHLVAALAATVMRSFGYVGDNAIMRVLVDNCNGDKIESSLLLNPDKSRISEIDILQTDTDPVDLRIICIQGYRIANFDVNADGSPVLTICINQQQLSAHIIGLESQLSSQSLRLADNLAAALEKPLQYLA